MRDVEETVRRLGAIKDLGVQIAIDDFGTGYSSLAHLRRFPVDALKIDRSFVTGMRENREGQTLIRTLVQLGKALSIETLAEGIEEHDELSLLKDEDCDSGQGFLFARPLDAEATEAFLAGRDGVVAAPCLRRLSAELRGDGGSGRGGGRSTCEERRTIRVSVPAAPASRRIVRTVRLRSSASRQATRSWKSKRPVRKAISRTESSLRDAAFELLRVGGGEEADVDEGVERAADLGRVDAGAVAGDHPVALEPADAVGGAVRAEADLGADRGEGGPSVYGEDAEDSVVDLVHGCGIVEIAARRRCRTTAYRAPSPETSTAARRRRR